MQISPAWPWRRLRQTDAQLPGAGRRGHGHQSRRLHSRRNQHPGVEPDVMGTQPGWAGPGQWAGQGWVRIGRPMLLPPPLLLLLLANAKLVHQAHNCRRLVWRHH